MEATSLRYVRFDTAKIAKSRLAALCNLVDDLLSAR